MSVVETLMVYLSKVGRGQKEAGGGTRAEEWARKWIGEGGRAVSGRGQCTSIAATHFDGVTHFDDVSEGGRMGTHAEAVLGVEGQQSKRQGGKVAFVLTQTVCLVGEAGGMDVERGQGKRAKVVAVHLDGVPGGGRQAGRWMWKGGMGRYEKTRRSMGKSHSTQPKPSWFP